MALVRLVDPLDDGLPEMGVDAEASQQVELSREQLELVQIRETLGVSWRDYAVLLGISPSRLNTYRYGRSVGVPSSVIEAARMLRAISSSELATLKQRLELPMSAIAQEWLAILHMKSASDMAAVLGVPAALVSRWLADEARPESPEIARLARTVAAIARLSAKIDGNGDSLIEI